MEEAKEKLEVGEDTLSSVDESSLVGSSASKCVGGSEGEEDEEDGDSEEEEDMEPKLKYERLSADLKAILRQDAASSLAVHSKFLILGSHWGRIHLLDALGNSLPSRQAHPHTVTVNQVSIDHAGEFYASCSDDGRVVVTGLYTDENTHNFKMDLPVRSIAIDPIYCRANSGRRFMTGADDRLVMHEKTFLSRYKQTTLCEGEGAITNIKWRGRFAAWASSKGIRVYDVVDETTISLIQKPAAADCSPPEHCPWRIGWADQTNLTVAFGDCVRVCHIRKRTASRQEKFPDHYVEIVSQFRVDGWVCGVAPLDSYVVLLVAPKEPAEDGRRQRPQLMIVEAMEDDYNLISTDLLNIRGHEEYRPDSYHLECLVDDKIYYILCPKDLVVGKLRDDDDHIDWLIGHEEFEAALQETGLKEKLLKRHKYLDVGRKYLDFLLNSGEFDQAGVLCTKILGKNKKLWQEEVFKFAQYKKLKAVAPYLPTGDVRLDPAVYEMVLFEFLKTDPDGFLRFVRIWTSDLYNVAAIVNVVMEQLLIYPDNSALLRALATLFTYQRKYDNAMAMYLKLGHKDVFQLIRQHRLFSSIPDKVTALLDLDAQSALELFLDHTTELQPDMIAGQLGSNKRQLFMYLDALYAKDGKECPRKFHGQLVRLYADFAPHKLLPFLKSSDQYPIQEALDECEMRGMTPERIYLLARMGNTSAALMLIIREMSDIEQAVDFCKEHDDRELWSRLIDYSIDKPIFINYLLNNIGTHVDPRLLVEKIEPGLKIPGLRDSLIQIIRDYNLQVSLQKGCKKILVSDCYSLLQRKVRAAGRGLGVTQSAGCPVCSRGLLLADPERMTDLVVFSCRHTYHADCLADANVCNICCKSGKYDSNMTYYYRD